MKKIIWALVVVTLSLFLAGFFLSYSSKLSLPFLGEVKNSERPIIFGQDDVSRITNASVVSIYHHLKGTVKVPYFDMNWNTLELVYSSTKKPLELPADDYVRGSGFIVSSDGYIVTNAHVVSDIAYRSSIAGQLIGLRFLEAAKSDSTLKKFDAGLKAKGLKEEDYGQFAKDLGVSLTKELTEKITFTGTEELTVLNSSSSGSQLSELISKGFKAELVDVNKNYLADEKDVAILKIKATNLPTVSLDTESGVGTGEKIYVYGFPSSGQFNANDILVPTFTEGTVSGLKDSATKRFKVIQTSAKVSPGSSGGPLFNQKGEVVGVLTYATSASTVGDSFSFAIPISFAQDLITGKNIVLEKNLGSEALKEGIIFLENKRCTKAFASFALAKNINADFYNAKNIEPYTNKCLDIRARGESIDSSWDELKQKIKNLGNVYWVLTALGVIVLLGIVWVISTLRKRLKKDEEAIARFRNQVATPPITSNVPDVSVPPKKDPI